MVKDTRPVFLNLLQVRLPVTAVMSILHRVAGVILFLAIPVLVYYLQVSLQSEVTFRELLEIRLPAAPVIFFVLLLWSLSHHLFAGLRYLLLDIDVGIDKRNARVSAWFVVIVAPVVTAAVTWWCL